MLHAHACVYRMRVSHACICVCHQEYTHQEYTHQEHTHQEYTHQEHTHQENTHRAIRV